MADVIKCATRDAYGAALKQLGTRDDILVLDADLAKATKTITFKKEFPEKFIDCGIAEGNMMGVAAGLATTGYTVFASSFAMFAAGRAFEQVRNSIAYPNLNVKIGATHAGISVGEDGASHQCCEDIALMRSAYTLHTVPQKRHQDTAPLPKRCGTAWSHLRMRFIPSHPRHAAGDPRDERTCQRSDHGGDQLVPPFSGLALDAVHLLRQLLHTKQSFITKSPYFNSLS